MSKMSDIDLMHREGEKTAEDFEARGFSPEESVVMAGIIAEADKAREYFACEARNYEPQPEPEPRKGWFTRLFHLGLGLGGGK